MAIVAVIAGHGKEDPWTSRLGIGAGAMLLQPVVRN